MWPFTRWRPFEPPTWLFRLLQVIAIPPIIASIPAVVGINVLSYFYYRPPYGMRRHIVANLVSTLSSALTLGCVPRRDPEEKVVPKLAIKYHSYLAEVGEPRMVPPLKDDVPRLDCIKAVGDKVKPESVPCFMLAPKSTPKERIWAKAKPGERVVFYIVGGGYVMGHPLLFYVPWELSNHSGLRVFSPNYRKCLNDSSGWPAPLLDFLSAYQYLIEELEFEPKNVLLLGASAGGHGCLALMRYLDELYQGGFTRWGAPPAGLFVSAPWADATASFPSIKTNAHRDWLQNINIVIVPAFGRLYKDATDPYMSPALAPASDGHFARLAKAGTTVHIDAGEDEVLRDEILALAESMRQSGVNVDLLRIPGGTHCEFVFARSPVKFWKGIGFSWPLIEDSFKKFLVKTWPDFELPPKSQIVKQKTS